MSTEKTLIKTNFNGQGERIEWSSKNLWKMFRNTTAAIVMILAYNQNIQSQNIVNLVNNIPSSIWTNFTTWDVVVQDNNAYIIVWEWDTNSWQNLKVVIKNSDWTIRTTLYVWDEDYAYVNEKVLIEWMWVIWDNSCWSISWKDGMSITQNSWFTDRMFCVTNTPLPVELTKFVAACENDGQQVRYVELKRETASEVNNEGFWIQKSADWKTWVNVAFVKWSGSSSQTQEYWFIDTESTDWDDDGIVYYRLEQNDFDGHTDYSDVVSVRDCDSGNWYEVSISPNPVTDRVTVSINQNEEDSERAQTIYIMNSLWQVIGKVSAGDANKVEIDMSTMPQGTYFIKTIDWNGSNVVTKSIVKI